MSLDLASVDHILTTTRSVRRRLDLSRPVPDDVLAECIDIATQAPTGGNMQAWRWVIVRDAGKRRAIGELYADVFDDYVSAATQVFGEEHTKQSYGDPGTELLAERLADVPVHVIPCSVGHHEQMAPAFENVDAPFPVTANFAASSYYASIWPAVWSFMLALRARGIGSSITTLHLLGERRAAEILGVPAHVTQVGLIPVAYFTGDDFRRGIRRPAPEITYWDTWGNTSRD